MEKFSIYNLLGLILPGAVLIFMLDILRNIFGILPEYTLTDSWETIVLVSIILGAILYVTTLQAVNNKKLNKHVWGLYKHVTDLYLGMKSLHSFMNETFNKRANEWYGKDIYISNDEYHRLTPEKQTEIKDLQDEFYDRMYYELDYENKNEIPKNFQSFYFFFRQLTLACLISFMALLLLTGLSLLPFLECTTPCMIEIITYFMGIGLLFIVSIWLGRWYRQRMVLKMYWAFYTHINLKK
jgi:hypothetical protein